MPDAAPAPQRLPVCRPSIDEDTIAEVVAVLRSGWITSGPKTLEFERAFAAYVGARHAVAVCSATAGLDIALELLDLRPGDEVITPSINWVSAPNLVELHGGRAVFADVDPRTLQIDPASVARLVGPRTRAVIPVHFAGAPCDLPALRAALPASVVVIEDAAHAVGTRLGGRHVGADAALAVFSFHPAKNMTTGEGGMVVTDRDEFADRLRLARFHGIRKDAWKHHGRSGRDTYEVVAPARKYNLTDIQAALGLGQLRRLDAFNARRGELAARYAAGLRGLRLLTPLATPDLPGVVHAWHLYVVLLELERISVDRADVVARLDRAGIGTVLNFPPVHAQQYYREKYPDVRLPATERVGDRLLSLPLFPDMTDADVDRVCAALAQIEREVLR